MLEKVKGFIIKTQDYGETHKIVTLFGQHTGKITAIARGAKKPKSRMAAVTQPFIYGEFLVYVTSNLGTMQQGDIVESFRNIREDLVKTAYTAYVMELTDKLLDQKVPYDYLLMELYETCCWIAENKDASIPIMMYELKLYLAGGFAPVVDRCVHCASKDSPFAFSIQEGGLLCKNCLFTDDQAIPLTNTIVKLLYTFLNVSLKQVRNVTVKQENIQLLRKILDAYYEQYGGYFLKSKRFLKQMDQLLD